MSGRKRTRRGSSKSPSAEEGAAAAAPAARPATAPTQQDGGNADPAQVSASSASADPVRDVFSSPKLTDAAARASLVYDVSAARALEEFRRFVTLKVILKDPDATILSPSPLMDLMWHAAILNTKLYRELQQQVGMTLDHSTDGAAQDPVSTQARQDRLDCMRAMHQLKWGAKPIEQRPAELVPGVSCAPSAPHAQPPSEPKALNLKIKSQDGNEVYFKLKGSTLLSKLISAYCKKVGTDLESVRFLFKWQRLRPDQTPHDLGMKDEDEIDAMVQQTGY